MNTFNQINLIVHFHFHQIYFHYMSDILHLKKCLCFLMLLAVILVFVVIHKLRLLLLDNLLTFED